MKVKAPDIDRVVQNILLYVNPKSPRLVEVLFEIFEGKLTAYACDDYVAVTDSCEVEGSEDVRFTLTIADAKELGEFIKLDKKVVHKSEIEVKVKHTLIKVSSNDSDTDVTLSFVDEPSWTSWDLVKIMLDEELPPVFIEVNAFRPERLAKLARLKADKEAPVDMRGIEINGKHLVQFRYGETITGCIMPVTRSYVDERFLWT